MENSTKDKDAELFKLLKDAVADVEGNKWRMGMGERLEELNKFIDELAAARLQVPTDGTVPESRLITNLEQRVAELENAVLPKSPSGEEGQESGNNVVLLRLEAAREKRRSNSLKISLDAVARALYPGTGRPPGERINYNPDYLPTRIENLRDEIGKLQKSCNEQTALAEENLKERIRARQELDDVVRERDREKVRADEAAEALRVALDATQPTEATPAVDIAGYSAFMRSAQDRIAALEKAMRFALTVLDQGHDGWYLKTVRILRAALDATQDSSPIDCVDDPKALPEWGSYSTGVPAASNAPADGNELAEWRALGTRIRNALEVPAELANISVPEYASAILKQKDIAQKALKELRDERAGIEHLIGEMEARSVGLFAPTTELQQRLDALRHALRSAEDRSQGLENEREQFLQRVECETLEDTARDLETSVRLYREATTVFGKCADHMTLPLDRRQPEHIAEEVSQLVALVARLASEMTETDRSNAAEVEELKEKVRQLEATSVDAVARSVERFEADHGTLAIIAAAAHFANKIIASLAPPNTYRQPLEPFEEAKYWLKKARET